MSKTIGIIGLGSIGMRHAKNLLEMAHVVIGFDTSDAALQAMDERIVIHSIPIMMEKCDGIVVATPTSNHFVTVFRKLHKYKKPIFVEKPLAENSEGVYVASRVKMVGNNLRFHSCVKKAKEWLNEGLIGKPLWASFCVAQHNTKYTDPVVLNWGAHEFDLALYLLGPATVTAAAGDDQIFDTCLLHESGARSRIHCDYVTRPERRGFSIVGDRGTVSANLVWREASYTPSDEYQTHQRLIDDEGSFDQDYKDEMQAFIELIDGKPHPEAATGQDGLACLELILEAKRMAEK